MLNCEVSSTGTMGGGGVSWRGANHNGGPLGSGPIDRDYQGQLSWRLKSRVLMYSYATRGLGFLVRCATISRQLGQGRQRSGGSPLFMINHRSSDIHKS